MINKETIDAVASRASILDFAQDLQAVRRQASGITALCPFHSEKTPSFHVRDEGRLYHCFGCGVSGDVFSYVMKVYGVSFPDSIRLIAQKYGIPIIEESGRRSAPESKQREKLKKLNQIALSYFLQCASEQNSPFFEYLEKRGIKEETRKTFQLGYAPDRWQGITPFLLSKGAPEDLLLHSGLVKRNSKGELYDALRGRIVFPIYGIDRVLIGFGGRILPQFERDEVPKYLNSPETTLYRKSRVLYGLPLALPSARQEKHLFVVEGYFDVISLHQVGVRGVVATCGTSLTSGHVDTLARSVIRLSVLFDGDRAGRDAAAKTFPLFLNSGVEADAVFLPEGDDPDTLARRLEDQTVAALRLAEKSGLFECFIEYQARKLGVSPHERLSPRQKAQIATEIGKVITATKNPIELDEYLKQAAYLLKTEVALLKELIVHTPPLEPISLGDPKLQAESVKEENGQTRIQELSHAERVLLRATMVLKERALVRLQEHPELYGALSKGVLFFLEAFQELLELLKARKSDLEGQRSLIRELLSSFGPDWVQFWRESYAMAEDPDVECDKMLDHALLRLREEKVLESIQVLDASLLDAETEDSRAQILQSKIELTKRLKALREKQLDSALRGT